MALELLIQERGGPARTQVLPKEIAFFGRREDNDVVLPYTFVSSRHGRVFRREGSVFVEDMGSTNGILVNGEPITPMVPRGLRPDDRIEIEKIVIQAKWIEEFDEPDVPSTFHEELTSRLGPAPTSSPSFASSPAAAALASSASPGPASPPSTLVTPAPAPAPAPSSYSPPSYSPPSYAAPSYAAAAPAATPRSEPPTTMWELQAGAAAGPVAAAPAPNGGNTVRFDSTLDAGGGTLRLSQASLPDMLASGRMMQRQTEGTDSFALWELFFKGLGLLTIVAGLVLLVVVLLA